MAVLVLSEGRSEYAAEGPMERAASQLRRREPLPRGGGDSDGRDRVERQRTRRGHVISIRGSLPAGPPSPQATPSARQLSMGGHQVSTYCALATGPAYSGSPNSAGNAAATTGYPTNTSALIRKCATTNGTTRPQRE